MVVNKKLGKGLSSLLGNKESIKNETSENKGLLLIPIEKISPVLLKTVIALEDTDFYKHHGINFKGIMRALYKDILARSFVEGGSTITQQLARNLFLHKRKKLVRKLAEMVLAIQIERKRKQKHNSDCSCKTRYC